LQRVHIMFISDIYDPRVKPAPRILVIEDDAKTAASLEMYLRHAGYSTEVAHDGEEGLERVRERPDLVILDLMLPGIGGLDICRVVRAESNIPLIMLTARSTEQDKLRGLGAGADDYVTKPFSPREVVARVAAVLRRSAPATDAEIALDADARAVVVRGERVALTTAEFEILDKLVRAPNRVFTRDELLRGEGALDRTVDAHIKNLRRKIEIDRTKPERIVTVFGAGYKYVPAQ